MLLYKTNSIEYWIGRKLVKLKYVGLANIIFDELNINQQFHQEYLQELDIKQLIDEVDKINPNTFLEHSKHLRKLLKGDNNILNIILS